MFVVTWSLMRPTTALLTGIWIKESFLVIAF